MSAFCVFGMTEVVAKQSADKKSPPPRLEGYERSISGGVPGSDLQDRSSPASLSGV